MELELDDTPGEGEDVIVAGGVVMVSDDEAEAAESLQELAKRVREVEAMRAADMACQAD